MRTETLDHIPSVMSEPVASKAMVHEPIDVEDSAITVAEDSMSSREQERVALEMAKLLDLLQDYISTPTSNTLMRSPEKCICGYNFKNPGEPLPPPVRFTRRARTRTMKAAQIG
jgi:hypothetical protein